MGQELSGAIGNAGALHNVSLSSNLDPESFPDIYTPPALPQGLQKVSILGKLQSPWPTPGGFTVRQPAKTGVTKPVTIPGISQAHADRAKAHQGTHKTQPCAGEGDDRVRSIIDPCSVLSPEVIDDGQILGSWADRKITYGFKPAAVPTARSPAAESNAPYGFIPPDFVLKEPSASAFWPEARTCASAPFEAAAAFAQAARPIQRVAFNAACRVVAPDPPRNAGKDAPTLWPAHKPAWQAKRSDKHLPVEERLWRIRAKRAWIREQLQALRGFPDAAADAEYAEPWSDALALMEGMGGWAAVATGPEAQVPGSSSPNAMGDDSALHDSVMFGEDDPSASSNPVPPPGARTTVTCPSANGDMDMEKETPEPMENVVAGMYVRELSPPVKAQHALLAQLASRKLAAPDAMQPARIVQGFAPGNGSQGILKKAQELMNYQRTIEAAAHMGWQSNVGEVRDLANRGPKVKGCGAMRLGMLREDSAYEMHPEYRNAIKGGPVTMVKVPAEQEKAAWAGDLVPAFELDEPEAGDMIVVVVRLIDERTGRSRVVQRGKADMSGSAILTALDDQLAQVAKTHNLIKPTMELVRAGRVQWSREE